MTNEEMQRAIDFITQQQAQYAARCDEDKARLTRLEESFTTLVELARRRDERPDAMATLRDKMNEIAQSMIRLAETQSQRIRG